MPQIVPIWKYNKTIELSQLCQESEEPVFITDEGYSEMVIMSMDTYAKTMLLSDTYRKLDEGETSIQLGDVLDGFDSLQQIRENHGL